MEVQRFLRGEVEGLEAGARSLVRAQGDSFASESVTEMVFMLRIDSKFAEAELLGFHMISLTLYNLISFLFLFAQRKEKLPAN